MIKTCYQVSNDTIKMQFLSLEDAQKVLASDSSLVLEEISVELISPVVIDPNSKLSNDINFGNLLIRTFLLDNRLDTRPFPVEVNLQLNEDFKPIKELALLGDIKSVKILLTNMAISDIFTDVRKSKYLSMIDEYLL